MIYFKLKFFFTTNHLEIISKRMIVIDQYTKVILMTNKLHLHMTSIYQTL